MSLDPATPDEARQILGLKGLDKVGFWSSKKDEALPKVGRRL